MTANLLAHSDLFAAGIARSGAYNRTLTPFGFQAETRTFWEIPEIYEQMSPFCYAHKINEPILLIHGEADDNSGTFPIQSERLYMALKGHGATVRYVTLPHEAHGYAARESNLHIVAETLNWLDKYVKNAAGEAADRLGVAMNVTRRDNKVPRDGSDVLHDARCHPRGGGTHQGASPASRRSSTSPPPPGGRFFLKCENLQPAGAFKIRGAYNMVAQLTDRRSAARGVITYSSGNHGQAMALAARELGAPAVVVMPTTAPQIKIDGARAFGAEVIFAGTTSAERRARAEAEAAARGLTMVPPFDHEWIIAGQGTAGLEILEQLPDVAAVLVPIGGGGLLAGVAAAVKQVEPDGRGHRRRTGRRGGDEGLDRRRPPGHAADARRAIADGLMPVRPGDLTFAHVQQFVDAVDHGRRSGDHRRGAVDLRQRQDRRRAERRRDDCRRVAAARSTRRSASTARSSRSSAAATWRPSGSRRSCGSRGSG